MTFESYLIESLLYTSGAYVSVQVVADNDGVQEIQHQCRELLNVGLDIYNLHCTLIYSKKPFNKNTKLHIDSKRVFQGKIKEFKVWTDKNKSYFGIILDSDELVAEHKRLMTYDLIYDYPSFMPHITLEYDTKLTNDMLNSINEYFKNKDYVLLLNNEKLEPLKIM